MQASNSLHCSVLHINISEASSNIAVKAPISYHKDTDLMSTLGILLPCTWERHLTQTSQLATVQLSEREHKLGTTRLKNHCSASGLGYGLLCHWVRHFMLILPQHNQASNSCYVPVLLKMHNVSRYALVW